MPSYYTIARTLVIMGMILGCGPSLALSLQTNARTLADLQGTGAVLMGEDAQSATSGTIQSIAHFGNGTSASSASETGSLSASTDHFAGLGENLLVFESFASWSDTFLNSSGGAIEGSFSLDVPAVYMSIWDSSGTAVGPMRAGYEVQVLLDGAEIWRTSSEFVGSAYYTPTVLQEGVSVGYTLPEPSYVPPRHIEDYEEWIFYAQFDSISEQLALGKYGNGDSFELTYSLSVWALGNGHRAGVRVGAEGAGLVTMTPVPEPASLTLFALGLAGLAVYRRRGSL